MGVAEARGGFPGRDVKDERRKTSQDRRFMEGSSNGHRGGGRQGRWSLLRDMGLFRADGRCLRGWRRTHVPGTEPQW